MASDLADQTPEEILGERPWLVFAEGKVACPVCTEQLPVPVLARIEGEAEPHLDLKPDMTELWSHIWAHEASDETEKP